MKKKKFIINVEIDPIYLISRDKFLKALERELEWIKQDAIEYYDKNFKK